MPLVPTIPGPAAGSLAEGVGVSSSIVEIKLGQGRFLTLKKPIALAGQPAPFLAVGDPSVVDFYQVGPKQLRLIGKKLGTTDLTITVSSGETYEYEVQVVADLDVLRAQLQQMFPDAGLKLSQFREKLVVEGQARDSTQVARILSVLDTYIRSIQRVQIVGQIGDSQIVANDPNAVPPPPQPGVQPGVNPNRSITSEGLDALRTGTPLLSNSQQGTSAPGVASPGVVATNQLATNQVQVINLIRIPTSQQVLLKVRVAELNRTGFRQVGADFLATIPQFATLFGTQIGGHTLSGTLGNTAPVGVGSIGAGSSPFYGTFSHGQFNLVLNALRKNSLFKVLAEPNLVALNGHQASFLAGGQFAVPSSTGTAGGSAAGGATQGSASFKDFGVRLSFLPIILDNETVRLTVDPEVSSVDFSIGVTLVPGGSPVPGLNTRSAHTTVDLRQGETLAIAGLLSLSINGETDRIPGLGDLPYIGAFFSNTTSQRMEKELVILVTPYIVEPMVPGQVPATPGDEVGEPNDLEFFFMNRIESRIGVDTRSTTKYDDPLHIVRSSLVEKKYLIGASGYSK